MYGDGSTSIIFSLPENMQLQTNKMQHRLIMVEIIVRYVIMIFFYYLHRTPTRLTAIRCHVKRCHAESLA